MQHEYAPPTPPTPPRPREKRGHAKYVAGVIPHSGELQQLWWCLERGGVGDPRISVEAFRDLLQGEGGRNWCCHGLVPLTIYVSPAADFTFLFIYPISWTLEAQLRHVKYSRDPCF